MGANSELISHIDPSYRNLVVISGARRGIGHAVADRFLQSYNTAVIGVDNHPDIVEQFPERQGRNFWPVQLDICDTNGVKELFSEVIAAPQPLDAVVHAAGHIVAGTDYHRHVRDYPTETARQQVKRLREVNGQAAIHFVSQAVGALSAQENGGCVIGISSSKADFPDPYRKEYMLAKARFSEAMAIQRTKLPPSIRLIDVQPGNTQTDIDGGEWIDGSDPDTARAVQAVNEWWRTHFGTPVKTIAEAIYDIAQDPRERRAVIPLGRDALLGSYMSRLPGWHTVSNTAARGVYTAVRLTSR